MPVIINDFEIVTDRSTTTTPAPGAAPAEQPPATAPLTPQDVEHIVKHFTARRRRVLAD